MKRNVEQKVLDKKRSVGRKPTYIGAKSYLNTTRQNKKVQRRVRQVKRMLVDEQGEKAEITAIKW